jgi:hypothetical protein
MAPPDFLIPAFMSSAILQTFVMEAITDKSMLVYCLLQMCVYVTMAALIGYSGTTREDFLSVGTQPTIKPGWEGWWHNESVDGTFWKIPFLENPWYVHAGNVWYGISNAVTVYIIWQCMVVKEQVTYGHIHAKIACFAFCSGAIAHISQYLGFPGLGQIEMELPLKVFAYCQGMVTSFYPVNWICYNRCQQAGVNYFAKVIMVISCIVQSAMFTFIESGLFPSLGGGPAEILYGNTQGHWHFKHSAMHAGYTIAAVVCYMTMPASTGATGKKKLSSTGKKKH